MKITVERLSDSHDCETCGLSYADGAKVFFDGELKVDLSPVAHCYGGDDYQVEEVFKRVLEELGHEVEIV